MPVCRSRDNSQDYSKEHTCGGSNVIVKHLQQSGSSIVVATVITDMQES